MSFGIAIQEAIYTALTAALSVPVYDDVPQPDDSGASDDFPYVTIGEDVITYDDTDTEDIKQVSVTVHVWSRYSGRREVKQIQGQIYSALHRTDLSHPGYNFITLTEQSATSERDPDGLTRHGVQTYNLLIERV